MPKKVHQSAWVVCGYVEPSHFTQFPDSPQIGSQQEAEQTLDPAQVLGGSAIQSTPQWCTQFEWQIKDSDGVWQQLPYEVAHGVAKTVTMHGADVAAAKKELVKLLETDTEENKTKTKKAREQTERLKNVERWMIFNRRTGQLAVPEWIQKHIQADEQGRPQPKNPKTTSRPWLMTLKIVMVDTANVEISLRTDQQENAPFRRVRCLSLSQGTEKATLAHLTQGYSHLVSGNDEDDAEEDAGSLGDESSSDEQLPGDADGLEGQIQPLDDPAPAEGDKVEMIHANQKQDKCEEEEPGQEVALAPLPELSECVFIVYKEPQTSEGGDHKIAPPSEFRSRPAYVELEKEGLTDLPPIAGCGLFDHPSSRQWHSRFGENSNRAPSWSETLRSERKAILIALEAVWSWYCKDSQNKTDHKYLMVIQKKLKETTF